jgi:hypothetical protein
MEHDRAQELFESEKWFLKKCIGLGRGYKSVRMLELDLDDRIPYHSPGSTKIVDEEGRKLIIPLYMLQEYTGPLVAPKSKKSKRKKPTKVPIKSKRSKRKKETKVPTKSKRMKHGKPKKSKRTR